MIRFLKSRKSLFIAIPVVILCGFLLARKHRGPASLQEKVGFGLVKRESLVQKVTIAGSVIPNRRTVVTAPYQGYVKKLFVKIGDTVKQGDPLVTIAQSLLATDPIYPLRAPFSGMVVQVEKSEGEFVKENDPQQFILRIDDTSRLFILANAPEIDRVKVVEGQEALIKASAILNRSYKGIVREMSLAAKEKEQRWGQSQVEFSIRVEVTDADRELRPGMSVLIDIITNKRDNVLTLRHEFIHKNNNEYFVILKDGQKRPIEVGLQNEEAFEIKTGLNEAETVQQVDFAKLIQAG